MADKEKFEIIKKADDKEQLPENVVMMETPEGKFRIMYGYHDMPQRPEELGAADALALETGGEDYSQKEVAEKLIADCLNDPQYNLIVKEAMKNKKPIYFTDISKADAGLLLRVGLGSVETVVGLDLLAALGKDTLLELSEKKEISRRDFLKKFSKGAVGLYLSSELLENLLFLFSKGKPVDERSQTRAITRFLTELNEGIHPEVNAIILTLRNYLMAQKLVTIARKLSGEKNIKKEIAIVVGAAHSGIEKSLTKKDEERESLIKKLLAVPGLEEARKRIAAITRMDFDEKQNRWVATEIFKDPLLASLEQN